jgi:DNA-binding transcriptional MerR regulator
MQIGELARRVGTSSDTVRFYEKAGWLPRAVRRDNAYRDYGEDELDHLRLLIELRRLGMPLADAAQVAGWCHAGHCGATTDALPALLRARRAEVAERISALRALDDQLARLERHLAAPFRGLPVVPGMPAACCSAAASVIDGVSCACCLPAEGAATG